MNLEELLKYIEQWAAQFESKLVDLIEALDKRLQSAQQDLIRRIFEVLSNMFEFDGKNLKNTPKNIASLRKLDRLLDGFQAGVMDDGLALFASELLNVGGVTVDYFNITNPATKSAAIRKALQLLRAVIGIDEDGGLMPGEYLDRLGKSQAVRDEIRRYVVQSIVSKRSLSDFQKGFRLLVEGNADTDGALQKYWRQYAYDTYNQAHEVVNESMADELELQYFIYQGSIIPTTRAFCRKKAGKVFSRKEALNWKNDPDLIDKATAATYNPLIERGRYNCRHFLNYISEDLAVQLRPELKKQ